MSSCLPDSVCFGRGSRLERRRGIEAVGDDPEKHEDKVWNR